MPLRKVKGDFNDSNKSMVYLMILRCLLNTLNQYDNLLSNYRNTFIAKLMSDSIGYGASKNITREVGLTGAGRNTFKAFTDGSNKSLIQAEKLSNLLNTKEI